MTIIRNGVEIELTYEELVKAYYEYELNWDKEYISGDLIDQYNDDGLHDIMQKRLNSDDNFCEKVALRYRKYLNDQYGSDTEFDCLMDAYDYVKYYY